MELPPNYVECMTLHMITKSSQYVNTLILFVYYYLLLPFRASKVTAVFNHQLPDLVASNEEGGGGHHSCGEVFWAARSAAPQI